MTIEVLHCCITGKNSFGILFYIFFQKGKPFTIPTTILRKIEIIACVKHLPVEAYGIVTTLVFQVLERKRLKPFVQNIETPEVYRI